MKTKIYIRYILFVAVLSTAGACHDRLDVDLKSSLTSNSMWEDEGDAKSASIGAWNSFRNTFGTAYIFWGEYRSGLWGPGIETNSTYMLPFTNELNSTHAHANWASLYTTINNCNLILKYTQDITFVNEQEKNTVLANAFFIRAFCYYWIARIWGDAPVLLTGYESSSQDDLYPERDPAAMVFDQVGADLQEADALLEQGQGARNMVSKAAVNLLQADYYLWMYKVQKAGAESLQNAKSAVDQVIGNSQYTLLEDFEDVFNNKLNQEIVLAWSYVQDEFTGGYQADYLVPLQYISPQYVENPIKVGTHQQWIFLTPEYKSFLTANADDTRTLTSFDSFYDEPKNTTFQWINKYAGSWENQTRIFDSDIVVYRYADALLLGAEIENELGNTPLAVERLNQIAGRAYKVENYFAPSLPKEQVDEEIINERMREFVAEGKIWWDFIRFGVAFDKITSLQGKENRKNILLWPVHDNAINSNPNIKQTEGY